jgi:chemotaxis protein CheC
MNERHSAPVQVRDSKSLAVWFQGIPASRLEEMLHQAAEQAASGLSEMLGQPVRVTDFRMGALPIARVSQYAGDPEAEMVGVYLLLKGGLAGQALLLLPLPSARRLAHLLLEGPGAGDGAEQPGSVLGLADPERWALAEVGNLMVTYALNAMATSLNRGEPFYPSPPAVMFDMLAAMIDVIATPVAAQGDDLLVVACDLQTAAGQSMGADGTIQVHFWILPDPATRRMGIV